MPGRTDSGTAQSASNNQTPDIGPLVRRWDG